MKKVVVSIINYNRAEITKDCLKSLNQIDQKGCDVEVLVIDNASKEPIEIDEKEYAKIKIKVIYNNVNTGFSGGHNEGFRYGLKNKSDYVIILNNDTTVDPHFLTSLLECGDEHPDAGIVAPKIYFSKGSEFHKDKYKESELGKVIWYAGGKIDWKNAYWQHRGVDEVDHGQYDTIEATDFASGCCFAIKREVLEKVSGFDEKYFLYYEDSDLNERLKQLGYKIYYYPKSIIWHRNAGSTGGSGSMLQDYFTTRNRMLLGFRYTTTRTKLALIRESLRFLLRGREWQKKGVLDFYKGKFGKGSFPL